MEKKSESNFHPFICLYFPIITLLISDKKSDKSLTYMNFVMTVFDCPFGNF